ncbi:hypothetical protein ACIQRW_15335 [Streptomyces sp. NPDC091287]
MEVTLAQQRRIQAARVAPRLLLESEGGDEMVDGLPLVMGVDLDELDTS